jgi:hypothetical protein
MDRVLTQLYMMALLLTIGLEYWTGRGGKSGVVTSFALRSRAIASFAKTLGIVIGATGGLLVGAVILGLWKGPWSVLASLALITGLVTIAMANRAIRIGDRT